MGFDNIKKKYGGLGHHYGGDGDCGYDNFSVQIFDQVEQGDHFALADKEVFWQNQLSCYAHCTYAHYYAQGEGF